jgi:hypothetical protein
MLTGTKSVFKFFQIGDVPVSWSEAWYLNTPATTDLSTELALALSLAQKRIDCSGAYCYLKQIIVSDLAIPRHIRRYTPPSGGLVSTVFTGGSHASDFADTALQCVKRDPTRTTTGFLNMRGIPDEIVDFSGRYDPNPAFNAAFNNLSAQLTSQPWYFPGETSPLVARSATVANVVQGGDGRPIITLNPTVPPPNVFLAKVGKKVKVNISGIVGSAAINGQRVVYVQDALTLVLNRRTPIFPYVTGGNVVLTDPALYAIASFTSDRIISRKVGAPFVRIRGRSRVRKLA